MGRDGRTLDHKTLEEIRLMAVQRVWEGEKPSVVIASYGLSRQVIYKWLRDAKGKGRGLRALRSRKATGRPRRLTAKQEQQLFRWINGKDPRQHGFDFGLWTRLVVRKLIAEKFGVDFSVTAVGKLLARLNLTPQRPLKRAYERDPGDERRDVHRTARGPAAPSQEALDSDSRQLARPQGESGARLRRLDRWKVGIALPAWLRTGIEPGRIGMELYEENRDREAAARQGRISA